MKTDFFKQIARAAQYGHMIKHIEVEHAGEFPVIMPKADVRKEIGSKASEAICLRSRAWELRDDAFKAIERGLGYSAHSDEINQAAKVQEISISQILERRLRLDADSYCGPVNIADAVVSSHTTCELQNLVDSVYLPPRVARTFGDGGVPFAMPSDLFDVNAKPAKRIYAKLIPNYELFMLTPGELLMARSGQKYGLIGRVMMVNENHRGMFGSDDPIRIVPNPEKVRTGYLLAFLNDPALGRPSVVRNAYGTSVPHLDLGDIRRMQIPRLGESDENVVADLMDKSVRLSAEADRLENAATELAQEQIDIAINELSSSN